MPTTADDGQAVETEASSWRYQDGDIIVDEGLSAMEADESGQILEDYNAQMGSSAREEEPEPEVQPSEPAETAGTEEQGAQVEEQIQPEAAVETPPEAMAEEPADGAEADVVSVPAEEPAVQTEDGQTVEEPAAGEEVLTADAAEAPAEVQAPAEEQAADPDLTANSATALDRYWTWSDGKYKRGPGYLKGIDVSVWQGGIDWKKVKAAGVDFAILRCGWGPNKTAKDDSKFDDNVKGCVANGIPYGVYLYSYANTLSEASDEADHALRLLKANNCRIQYPVYYDLEDSQVKKAGSATITKMAVLFCSKLKSAGYPAGVYANLNWWNNKLSGFSGYDRWVAQWDTKCTYAKPYSIWQCTSSTHVSGISGRVDANLLMVTKSAMEQYMRTGIMSGVNVTYSLVTIDGKTYGLGSNGELVKNRFQKIGSYIYGFDQNGVMLKSGKRWLGCVAYTLDGQGRAYINKSKTKKKAPYYAKAGSGKKGTLKKGKKFYVLRTSGKWSQMANGYWVKTKLIKKIAVYPSIKPNIAVKYKAKVKKKSTSRSGPSNGYIKKKTFKKNKTVTVIGTYGGWSKLSSGQWLPSSRLKKK